MELRSKKIGLKGYPGFTAFLMLLFVGCAGSPPLGSDVCGDGVVSANEECDDGNTISGDGCSATCQSEGGAVCGNSVIEAGEACDDGNTDPGDGCDAACQVEGTAGCGNGVIEAGEACDDGNTDPGDGCDATCQVEGTAGCGNGVLEAGEECDDGNTASGDGCSATCQSEGGTVCGDGLVEGGEECDDGAANSDTDPDACREDCRSPWCGDGVVDAGEECEPPGSATCDTACGDIGPFCGDGTCDVGEDASTCPTDCPVTCGDAICSAGEDASSCPADCPVTCGDAICSAGEDNNNCPADCPVTCGDAICGAGEDASSCPADCPVTCGDAICSAGEDASSCPADCPVTCGDSICSAGEDNNNCPADCPVTCGDSICSAGEDNNNCAADCNPVCGNSVIESGEQCDPPDGSACDNACQTIATCTITGSVGTLGGASITGSTATGFDDIDAGCGYQPGEEAIYTFTATTTGNYVASLVNPGTSTSFDTVLSVREGSCPGGTEVACNDDSSGLQSQVTFAATAGTTYYLIVEGYSGTSGNFEMTVHAESVCEGVAPVVDITATVGNSTTTMDTSTGVAALSGACGGGAAPDGLVTFTAPRTGSMVASTNYAASTYDTRIYVREGDCDSWGSELACNDDDGQSAFGSPTRSQVAFDVTAGETYYLLVDGFGSGSGAVEVGVGYGGQSPFNGAMGACGHDVAVDVYRVFVTAGDSLHVRADTISAGTAADLCVQIFDTDTTTQIGNGDDELACTYPPPSWNCPDTTVTVSNTGFVYVQVNQCSTNCVDVNNIEYELTVERNGAAAIVMGTEDN